MHSLTKLENSDSNDSQDNINRNSNNASNPSQNQNNRLNQGQKKKNEKKNRVLIIPKFLVNYSKINKNERFIYFQKHKLSSTYFQRALNESVISPKGGSISAPSNDTKIKDKQPEEGQKKGIFAQISGRGINFCLVFF